MKIYIANHCKEYYEDGSHHEKCEVPLKEALEIMSDKWIEDGNYCIQTIMNMRDCLKELIVKDENRICANCEHGQSDQRRTERMYCKYFHIMVDDNHFCKEFKNEE